MGLDPVADMTCFCFYCDRRTGLTLAGKRIRKGCEVHRSGDYLNEVKMLQLCKSPYVVTLHGCSAQRKACFAKGVLVCSGKK